MKRITILLTTVLFFSAGVVKSQAPLSDSVLSSLESMITSNKALLDSQAKTLDTLDQLDQSAQQLKIFGKRS